VGVLQSSHLVAGGSATTQCCMHARVVGDCSTVQLCCPVNDCCHKSVVPKVWVTLATGGSVACIRHCSCVNIITCVCAHTLWYIPCVVVQCVSQHWSGGSVGIHPITTALVINQRELRDRRKCSAYVRGARTPRTLYSIESSRRVSHTCDQLCPVLD
jgi:hypothetical protein